MSWMPKLLLVAASQARTETLHVYEYDASVSPSASTCTREQVCLTQDLGSCYSMQVYVYVLYF